MKQNLKSLQANGSFTLGNLEHPNKMPFEGILSYFDVPSDRAVGGTNGKKVMIPSEFGIPSLASLQGMAIDFDPLMMDKHVTTHKIGIIEKAWAGAALEDGSTPVHVSGYVFAHDFPGEAANIKEFQSDLGFSYETINTPVVEGMYKDEQVLVVCGEVMFSGAAILLTEKAAYTQTSLAAQAEEKEVIDLPIEEIIAKVIESLETKYTLTAKAEEFVAEAVVEEIVEPVAKEPVVEPVVEVVEPVLVPEPEPVVEPVVEEVKEEGVVETTVDFQAMATDLQAAMEAMKQELADLKAEKVEVAKYTHKGFPYPTTLAAKYNFEANADSYEAQIAAVDARTDLEPNEAMALKWEIRAKALKK